MTSAHPPGVAELRRRAGDAGLALRVQDEQPVWDLSAGPGRPLRRYGIAIAVTVLTTAIMVALRPVVQSFASPPFLFAVLFVAWYAGFGPALVAAGLGVGALSYFFVGPADPVLLSARDLSAITVFMVVALFMAWLVATVRRTRDDRAALLLREAAARADAQDANRAKDEFLAILGHEFRTPLAAIDASLRRLETPGLDDETQQRIRAIIRRQTDQLRRMVDDLLDVNRLISDGVVLDCRPLDLAEMAAQSATTVISAGKAKRHAVTIEAEPVWVHGDPGRLERVIVNLLDNAFKYTPSGDPIVMQVKPDGPDAVVVVRDRGIGIAPEQLPRIFDLFSRVEAPRGRGGLGIGLAVVRRLVELHGGTIEAASDGLGRGSSFTVRLPRMARPSPRVRSADHARQSVHPAC
jgi:signal transduction histidine kinase